MVHVQQQNIICRARSVVVDDPHHQTNKRFNANLNSPTALHYVIIDLIHGLKNKTAQLSRKKAAEKSWMAAEKWINAFYSKGKI